MALRAKIAETWQRHESHLKPILLGIAAGALLAFLAVPIDTKVSEDDPKLVGDTIAILVPVLAAAMLLVSLLAPSLRLGSAMAAHAIVTVYPFLLPLSPWWALGPAIGIHLVAFFLQSAPWTRLATALLGAPLLLQAAYREDLGPYNPLLAGLVLSLHLVLLWLLLPPGTWRRVPHALLTGAFLLVALLSIYSLTQALEGDRILALVLATAATLGMFMLPRSRLATASIPSLRLHRRQTTPLPTA